MIDIHDSIFGNANTDIVTGAMDALLTMRLGAGSARTVYAIGDDNENVLKIEHCDLGSPTFQNVIEFSIWSDFMHSPNDAKWLAKCVRMSGNGRALIQERLDIITDPYDPRLPKRIPRFFTDTKVSNWGVAKDGTVKCCDYGVSLLMQGNPWQLRKANWWAL